MWLRFGIIAFFIYGTVVFSERLESSDTFLKNSNGKNVRDFIKKNGTDLFINEQKNLSDIEENRNTGPKGQINSDMSTSKNEETHLETANIKSGLKLNEKKNGFLSNSLKTLSSGLNQGLNIQQLPVKRPTESKEPSFESSFEDKKNFSRESGQNSGLHEKKNQQEGPSISRETFSSRPEESIKSHLGKNPQKLFEKPDKNESSSSTLSNSKPSFGGNQFSGQLSGGNLAFKPIHNQSESSPTNGNHERGIPSALNDKGNLSNVISKPTEIKHTNVSIEKSVQESADEDEKDICFHVLGCFAMGKPWKSALRPVGKPFSPEQIQTTLFFYSRDNPKNQKNITLYPKIDLNGATFDPQKITAIIVHGFANSGNATWMKQMKDAYLKQVDANVMIVDWGKGAQHINYFQVCGNTRVVGKQLALFVEHLKKHYGADTGKFHLIGHSLGAQICSYLAKDVPGIARLTAMDPAQPAFEGFDARVRLDKSDADFVDVIHTDAKPFLPTFGFGMMAPHGHVDFYVNGGFDQPGCIPLPKKEIPQIKSLLDLGKFPVEVIAKTVACPHTRAYQILIESFNEINNCIFWGHKTDVKNFFKSVANTLSQGLLKKLVALSSTCNKDDCVPLGFATKKSPLRGSFIITTNSIEPFCISEPGIPPENIPYKKSELTFSNNTNSEEKRHS